jgi:hypothetical protein
LPENGQLLVPIVLEEGEPPLQLDEGLRLQLLPRLAPDPPPAEQPRFRKHMQMLVHGRAHDRVPPRDLGDRHFPVGGRISMLLRVGSAMAWI